MTIAEIETAIVSQLSINIPDLKVESFPDEPSKYKLIHPKGAALVCYVGSKFSNPDSYSYFRQTEELEFGITLITRALRGATGIYAYIDTIISCLSNFIPKECSQGFIRDFNFVSENNGEWQYGGTFVLEKENIK